MDGVNSKPDLAVDPRLDRCTRAPRRPVHGDETCEQHGVRTVADMATFPAAVFYERPPVKATPVKTTPVKPTPPRQTPIKPIRY